MRSGRSSSYVYTIWRNGRRNTIEGVLGSGALAQGGYGNDSERVADMSVQTRCQSLWRALPFIGFIVSEWWAWHEEQAKPRYDLTAIPDYASELPPYPIDMWPLLALPFGALDESGVPYNAETKIYSA